MVCRFLIAIGVEESMRRKGIGSALMESVLRIQKEFQRASFLVSVLLITKETADMEHDESFVMCTNAEAKLFFEKLKFEVVEDKVVKGVRIFAMARKPVYKQIN